MSEVPMSETVVGVAADSRSSSMLRRVHGLTGAIALGGYTALHLAQGWAVFSGRETWVLEVASFALGYGAAILALTGLAAHAISGLWLARAEPFDPVAAVDPKHAVGYRRIQQITGVILLAWLAIHLLQVAPFSRQDAVLVRQGHEAIRLWLETPAGLATYVIGTTALAFHWMHGLARLAVSLGWVITPRSLQRVRYLAGAVGIVVWLCLLHWVGYFANGVGLWPITGEDDPEPTEQMEDMPNQEAKP